MGSIVKGKRNIIGLLTRQEGSDNRFVYTCTRCGSEFELANELETHFQIHNNWTRQNIINTMTSEQMEVRETGFLTQSTRNQQTQSQS